MFMSAINNTGRTAPVGFALLSLVQTMGWYQQPR
jgi:hypothetical protein